MNKIIITLIIFSIPFLAAAQILEEAFPFIQNYTVADYKKGNQNWDIIQDKRGLIYVANNDGLLEFDGITWRVIKGTSSTVISSLAINEEGTIFVGGKSEIGFLKLDSIGDLNYTSFLNKVPEEYHNFDRVWETWIFGDTLIFQTSHKIFFYRFRK